MTYRLNRPQPPKKDIPRRSGFVESSSWWRKELTVFEGSAVVYIPLQPTSPAIENGQQVVIFDYRNKPSADIGTQHIIEPARMFTRLDRSRPPVLYVLRGKTPSKPVPPNAFGKN